MGCMLSTYENIVLLMSLGAWVVLQAKTVYFK